MQIFSNPVIIPFDLDHWCIRSTLEKCKIVWGERSHPEIVDLVEHNVDIIQKQIDVRQFIFADSSKFHTIHRFSNVLTVVLQRREFGFNVLIVFQFVMKWLNRRLSVNDLNNGLH